MCVAIWAVQVGSFEATALEAKVYVCGGGCCGVLVASVVNILVGGCGSCLGVGFDSGGLCGWCRWQAWWS